MSARGMLGAKDAAALDVAAEAVESDPEPEIRLSAVESLVYPSTDLEPILPRLREVAASDCTDRY